MVAGLVAAALSWPADGGCALEAGLAPPRLRLRVGRRRPSRRRPAARGRGGRRRPGAPGVAGRSTAEPATGRRSTRLLPSPGSGRRSVVTPLLQIGRHVVAVVAGPHRLDRADRARGSTAAGSERRAAARSRAAGRRPLQVVAADVRRLGRQIALVPAGAPMARRRALAAAYEDVLIEAADAARGPERPADDAARAGPRRRAAAAAGRRSRTPGWRCTPDAAGSSSPSTRRRRRGPTSTGRWRRCATRPARRAGPPPDRWHLTLLFLGAVPGDACRRCVPRPATRPCAAAPPMTLRLAGGGRFGSRAPSAGVLGRAGRGRRPLIDLAGRLRDARARRWACRSRTGRSAPHLTLGPLAPRAGRPTATLPGAAGRLPRARRGR